MTRLTAIDPADTEARAAALRDFADDCARRGAHIATLERSVIEHDPYAAPASPPRRRRRRSPIRRIRRALRRLWAAFWENAEV